MSAAGVTRGFLAATVISTRNRAEALGDFLTSLQADSATCDREVVVDNGSTDDTKRVVVEAAAAAHRPCV